ncbi:glycosyltransferase [Streptomyces morookaense]|uniref:DUF1205 domain-containing protein n=1 Tax=Streptomyces morookaense TaxID=1970 RepID=A0A7Y7B558_STRMO|nr:glycosyltransferase [Streptomyces morookaense]NVK79177.1 DUF1205 domain-containing protein [Streptomyces morookaense]GHF27966.1 glycosyl transferase [Streptomyces morookaense]
MRTLFVCWAWPSHLYPMVPIAAAMRASGHDVLIGCPPSLVPVAVRTGLPSMAVGHDFDLGPVIQRLLLKAKPGASGPRRRDRNGTAPRTPLDSFSDTADAMADGLLEACRLWRPDVIVHDATTYAATAVGRALGIPTVRHLWGIDYTYLQREFEPVAFGPLYRRLGLDEVVVSGETPTLDPCPSGLQLPVDYRPVRLRHIPYNGSAVHDPGLLARSRRPRLCITWGTTSSRFGDDDPVLTMVLEAAADLAVDVVFATTGKEATPVALQPHWRTAVMQPLHLLLPYCDAVVSPGGSGTVMTGVMAGLPQVCLPLLPDQQVTADRLVASGAGLRVTPRDATRASVRDALEAVLTDARHADAARGLREDARQQPSPRDAARFLERLAAGCAPEEA